MARALLVGCGCRGGTLAERLVAAGHAVRGTTRDPASLAGIEDRGAEAVIADPNRLGTILPHLTGVSVVCWLLGSAAGPREEVAALHGPRLRSLLAVLVDTPVRGFVYEAAGKVPPPVLAAGAAQAQGAGERHRMPVEVVAANPVDPGVWVTEAAAAVERALAA